MAYNASLQNSDILFLFLADVFTVIWFSRPFKDRRLTLKRNTVKSCTSVPTVQLPSRPMTTVKFISKVNTVLAKYPLSKFTSHDSPVKSFTCYTFFELISLSFCRLIFKCSCETIFKKKQLLFQHFHQNANKRVTCVFKCPECNSVFPQKQLLMQHFKVCPVCILNIYYVFSLVNNRHSAQLLLCHFY